MTNQFSFKSIVEIAKDIEQRGVEFYHNYAGRVKDPLCKTLFLDLVQMEKEHLAVFSTLASGADQDISLSAAKDDERYWYLKALADTRVFFEFRTEPKTMTEVLKRAVAAEKESIAFYLGVKGLVHEGDIKKKIDGIIREEMSHLALLGKQLAVIKDYEL